MTPTDTPPAPDNSIGSNSWIDIAAWIKNATDEEVATLSSPQTLFGSIDGGRQVYLNDPKTYGVTLRYTF